MTPQSHPQGWVAACEELIPLQFGFASNLAITATAYANAGVGYGDAPLAGAAVRSSNRCGVMVFSLHLAVGSLTPKKTVREKPADLLTDFLLPHGWQFFARFSHCQLGKAPAPRHPSTTMTTASPRTEHQREEIPMGNLDKVRQGKGKRRTTRSRPSLEWLEHRVTPSTFHVNTLLDTDAVSFKTGKDASGHVSLRSAIMAADAQGGSNKIILPAGTFTLTLAGSRRGQRRDRRPGHQGQRLDPGPGRRQYDHRRQ